MGIKSFSIEDKLDDQSIGAVEVTVTLDSGEQRWCYFFTPEGLGKCGDFIPGTEVRVHYDAPYMIVVSELSESIIEKALSLIDSEGDLERCTKPLKD